MKTSWYRSYYAVSVEPSWVSYGQDGPTPAAVVGSTVTHAQFREGYIHGWVQEYIGPEVVPQILAVLDAIDAGKLYSEEWARYRAQVEAWYAIPVRTDLADLYGDPDEDAVSPTRADVDRPPPSNMIRDPGGLQVCLAYGKSYVESADGRAELRSWAPEVLFCEGRCYIREGDTIRVFSPDLTETFPAEGLRNTLGLDTTIRISGLARKGNLVLARWWSVALPLPVAAVLGEKGYFLIGPAGILARSPRPD